MSGVIFRFKFYKFILCSQKLLLFLFVERKFLLYISVLIFNLAFVILLLYIRISFKVILDWFLVLYNLKVQSVFVSTIKFTWLYINFGQFEIWLKLKNLKLFGFVNGSLNRIISLSNLLQVLFILFLLLLTYISNLFLFFFSF